MRALIQRVSEASVSVDGETVGAIGPGLLILLGAAQDDTAADAEKLAVKLARLRAFDDEGGRMNRSLLDLGVGGGAVCISQFTLYGDVRRGLRPSFTDAARPEAGEALYEEFCTALEGAGVKVQRGGFGARMSVALRNEGPVTLMVEI